MIDTARLRLVPSAPRHLLALIESVQQFEAQSGLKVAAGLREMFTSGDVSPQWLEQLRVATDDDPWKHGFFIVHGASRLVIGSVGFKGPPDGEGMVEIAYGVAPAYQSQGYATEAAAAGVAFAFQTDGVTLVRAHTLPENNASTRVLAKCGFSRIGEVIDPDDGLVWRWELAKAAN